MAIPCAEFAIPIYSPWVIASTAARPSSEIAKKGGTVHTSLVVQVTCGTHCVSGAQVGFSGARRRLIPGCCRIVTGTDYILTPQGEPSCASCFEKIVPASIDPASSAAQSTAHIPKPEAYDKPVSTPNPRRHLGTASGKGLGGTSVSSFVSVRSRILALNSNLPG
jgi:hypothetical protein